MKKYLFPLNFALIFLFVFTEKTSAQNIFKSKINQQIWEAKDRNDVVFTKQILKKGTKEQKNIALKGLMSWNDNEFRKPILKILKKSNTELRMSALEAIGQSRDSFYIQYLIKVINKKKYKKVRKQALVALGKCITNSHIEVLKEIKKNNTEGFSECLYRAMLKGVSLPEFTDIMVIMLNNIDKENVFYAANYLARTKNNLNTENLQKVFKVIDKNIDNEILNPLLIAIAKSKSNKIDSLVIRELFNKNLKSDNLSTKINVLRAISISKFYFDPEKINLTYEKNDLPQLQLTASDIVKANCENLNLYKPFDYSPALLNIIDNQKCKNTVKLIETGTFYDKIWHLKSIEHDYTKYQEIQNILLQSTNPAIKAAATESLIACANSKGFPAALNDDFIETLTLLIKDRDVGVLSIIANSFIENKITRQTNYNLYEFIELFNVTLSELILPREIEAFTDISKAISEMKDTAFVKPIIEWNTPIDWKYVEKISSNQKIEVTTNKGKFTITLNVNEAPGSVSSILKLVEEGFYNDKYFHRVVPNFVIQGGCPRGDGFGSLDYSLRSEFSSIKYNTGTVGLASSGANTESCQWFVTHCPTPHLDGRYTVIGIIDEGMNIVNMIGVGDKIISIIKK